MNIMGGWEIFYVIVGSSAGALIGLQFVVITLISDAPLIYGNTQASSAFATPSVVHFGVVLLLSALANAPWNGISTLAILWGILGVYGIIYSVIVARRLALQTIYQPVIEDWLFHVALPCFAYVALAGSACMPNAHARPSLFLVGGAVLLLLFSGIHNAWDAVTYHVFVQRHKKQEEK